MTENERLNEALEDFEALCNGKALCVTGEALNMVISAVKKSQEFEAIGTIEEFKALKEKDTPKKPIIKEWCPAICPNCKQNLSESKGDGYWLHYTSLERCDCGQKLDWSE